MRTLVGFGVLMALGLVIWAGAALGLWNDPSVGHGRDAHGRSYAKCYLTECKFRDRYGHTVTFNSETQRGVLDATGHAYVEPK